MNPTELAQYIDHTFLKPDLALQTVHQLCDEAKEYHFKAVCIPPFYVKETAHRLQGSNVLPVTVIGFPMGYSKPDVVLYEAKQAQDDGAKELDMVINLAAFKSGMYREVEEGIRMVVDASAPIVVKVILEVAYLNDDEIVKACQLSKSAGAGFVKTSTGFAHKGASVEAVALMRKTVGHDIGVKASGGIKDRITALSMIEAGANRIGTSSGVQIMKER